MIPELASYPKSHLEPRPHLVGATSCTYEVRPGFEVRFERVRLLGV